jgi:hypothetical protein
MTIERLTSPSPGAFFFLVDVLLSCLRVFLGVNPSHLWSILLGSGDVMKLTLPMQGWLGDFQREGRTVRKGREGRHE